MSYGKWAGMAAGSIVIVIIILAALEAARRRGMDPVARIADVLSPPMAAGGVS